MTFRLYAALTTAAFGLGICASGVATAGNEAAQASLATLLLVWLPVWAVCLVMAAFEPGATKKGGAS